MTTTQSKKFQKLTPQMRQAFFYRFQGLSAKDIAEKVNRSRHTVSEWFAHPWVASQYNQFVQHQLARMSRRLEELGFKVVKRLEHMLDSQDDMAVLRAIDIYNKMTGRYKLHAQIEVNRANYLEELAGSLTDEEIEAESAGVKAALIQLEGEGLAADGTPELLEGENVEV